MIHNVPHNAINPTVDTMTTRAQQIPTAQNILCSVITSGTKNSHGTPYTDDIGLRYIKGNSDSYFTFPRQLVSDRLFNDLLGEDTFKKARELIRPLHLSNRDGSPMNTVENGFYFVQLANGVLPHKYTQILAEHLRVPYQQAETIVATCSSKDEFSILVDTMRDRWEQEAITAFEFIRDHLIPLSQIKWDAR